MSAVTPVKFLPEENSDVLKIRKIKSEVKNDETDSSEKWLPKTDLSHLNDEKREIVENLLLENCEAFSKSDIDIGDIKDLQMQINLMDTEPVKEPYRRIPHNLYDEVKKLYRRSDYEWVGPRIIFCLRESHCVCQKKRWYVKNVCRL